MDEGLEPRAGSGGVARDPSAPRLSVITAAYQAGATIGALAHSLEQQAPTQFEWIVQDGGSTDSTREIVETARIGSVDFVSKTDDGIYDAFNRALDRARGEYVLFLGADDRVASPGVLAAALEELRRQPGPPDALLCSVVDDEGRPFRSRLSAMTLVFNTVHHQGVLYRRSLFEQYRYRTDSKVVADYELNLMLRLTRARVARSDLIIAECDGGGISHTADEWHLYRDLHHLRRRHMPALVSSGLLAIGIANVARRRLTARRFIGRRS